MRAMRTRSSPGLATKAAGCCVRPPILGGTRAYAGRTDGRGGFRQLPRRGLGHLLTSVLDHVLAQLRAQPVFCLLRRLHGVGRQAVRFIPQVLGDFGLTVVGVLAFESVGLHLPVARILTGSTSLVFNYVVYR
jgi:hypothetical protein